MWASHNLRNYFVFLQGCHTPTRLETIYPLMIILPGDLWASVVPDKGPQCFLQGTDFATEDGGPILSHSCSTLWVCPLCLVVVSNPWFLLFGFWFLVSGLWFLVASFRPFVSGGPTLKQFRLNKRSLAILSHTKNALVLVEGAPSCP